MSKNLNLSLVQLSLLIVLFVISACRKHGSEAFTAENSKHTTAITAGLPYSTDKLNGFLFAECASTIAVSLNTYEGNQWQFAVFAEPATALCDAIEPFNSSETFEAVNSNVAPGEITVNGDTLKIHTGPDFTIKYSRTIDSLDPDSVMLPDLTWAFAGNGSFSAAAHHFEKPFPQILLADSSITMYTDSFYTLTAGHLMTNFDSLRVAFVFNPAFPSVRTRVSFHAGLTSITLSPNELMWLKTKQYQARIRFKGYKYFHKWENGKLYLFQFSTSREIPLLIDP